MASFPVSGFRPTVLPPARLSSFRPTGLPVMPHGHIGSRHPKGHPTVGSLNLLQAAQAFFKATYGQMGLDANTVRSIFQQVHQQKTHVAFESAVQEEFQRHGYRVSSPLTVLQKECLGSPWIRPFKQSEYQGLEEVYFQGKESYRATPGQYRLFGMWQAMKEFVTICKHHPIASTGIIGAVAWSGHRWPFWGGLTGAAILAWSSLGMIRNEWKAQQLPERTQAKAEQLISSGENLTGLLLTLFGADEIYKSFTVGMRTFAETSQALKASTHLTRWTQGVKNAFLSQPTQSPTWFQKFRFVSGLFDNVLMPFNAVAEQLQTPKPL